MDVHNGHTETFCTQHPCSFFYVTTLCVSAVFAVANVCPSVTLVYCIQTAEDIVKLLSRPSSPILVFLSPAPIPNSEGNPFSGECKIHGVGKLAIFNGNRRLCRKRHKISPWLLWNVNRKSYALYWMVTFSISLTDP